MVGLVIGLKQALRLEHTPFRVAFAAAEALAFGLPALGFAPAEIAGISKHSGTDVVNLY